MREPIAQELPVAAAFRAPGADECPGGREDLHAIVVGVRHEDAIFAIDGDAGGLAKLSDPVPFDPQPRTNLPSRVNTWMRALLASTT